MSTRSPALIPFIALFLSLPAAGSETPGLLSGSGSTRLYSSASSLYETALGKGRALDLHAALEFPLAERHSLWAGLGLGRFEPGTGPEAFSTRSWRVQAAYRHHPWEWMPGFFAQGVADFGRSRSSNPTFVPGPTGHPFFPDNPNHSYIREIGKEALEFGLGFGYLWTFGPLAVDLQGIFGPRIRWETVQVGWKESDGILRGHRIRSRNSESLLRFYDLRIGISL